MGWGSGDIGFRTFLFGTDYPSPRRVAAVLAMAGVFVAGLFGEWIAFMPLAVWRAWTGIAIALSLAIFAVAAMARVLLRSTTPRSREFLAGLVVIGIPMLAWGLHATLAVTLPSAWTRVFGEAWRQDTVAQVYERAHRRRGCPYRLAGGALERTRSGGFCLSRETFELHQGTHVAVTLVGRRSALGVLVQSVEYRDGRQ